LIGRDVWVVSEVNRDLFQPRLDSRDLFPKLVITDVTDRLNVCCS